MSGTPPASGAVRPRSLAGTLLVVGLSVALALAAVLGWGWRHEREQLEGAQKERAARLAEVTRLLLQDRVDRAGSLLRAIAASEEVREGLADGSQSAVIKALQPFDAEFDSTLLLVHDPSGRVLGWSTPMAMMTLDPDLLASGPMPRWGVVGSDAAALLEEPVVSAGRDLGTVRAAVLTGRVFVRRASLELGGPVAVAVAGEVVNHTFPVGPDLPAPAPGAEPESPTAFRAQLGEGVYDLAARPLPLGDGPLVQVLGGVSREPLAAAAQRYRLLSAAVGGGGLAVVLLAVGSFLLVARQRDAARLRSAGLEDRLAQLAAVVHDIKAPVSGIQLRAEALGEEAPDAGTRGALDRIVDTCERLNLYLVNVLTAAHAEEQDGLRPRPEPVLLPGLLEEVAERLAPQAERRGVRLTVSTAGSLPPRAVDPLLLERALVNLGANAITATPAGGTVELFAEPADGGGVALGSRDTGPGFTSFPPEQAFRRERPRVKDASFRSGSTGFGLYIVARIAEAHGGRALSRNRPDGGAEVWLELP
jgi:signal transduction histidine kinase